LTAFKLCYTIVCLCTLLENPYHSQQRESRDRSACKKAHSRLQFWAGPLRCRGAPAGADVKYKHLASFTPRNWFESLIPSLLKLPASSRRPPTHVVFTASALIDQGGGGADANQKSQAKPFECECPSAGCKLFDSRWRRRQFQPYRLSCNAAQLYWRVARMRRLARDPEAGESGFAAGVHEHIRKLDIVKKVHRRVSVCPSFRLLALGS